MPFIFEKNLFINQNEGIIEKTKRITGRIYTDVIPLRIKNTRRKSEGIEINAPKRKRCIGVLNFSSSKRLFVSLFINRNGIKEITTTRI